jgi:AmpD protein
MAVDTLIVHYISLPPGVFAGDAAERLFLNQLDADSDPRLADLAGLRVSAHFLIRRRGEVIQFVATDDRAWHAGPSRLGERERCNDFSIGIELEGDSLRPFTAAQYRRLDALVNTLRTRHPLAWVAGHNDIAPGRKEDPGPMFDWKRVASGSGFMGLVRPF